MKLMTKQLEKHIPELYSEEDVELKDKKIYAHYMSILLNYDWFAFEYSKEQKLFFGFVNLDNEEFAELGYFSLEEFEEVNQQQGFKVIERDMHFQSGTVEEVAEKYPVLKKLI